MLKLNSLPDATRRVFEILAASPLMTGFTLVGGTALALQLSHRQSEDLDFWWPAERMNKDQVSAILYQLRANGLQTRFATAHDQIVNAKINGIDLLSLAQDHVIEGVKVTFYARLDAAYLFFDAFPRCKDSNTSFQVMGTEGLFAMKSHLIHHRVRSRDLYDLRSFLSQGKSLQDILQAGLATDPSTSIEYAKSVLIGQVPLDIEDEGFASIGVQTTLEAIHHDFRQAVDAYEQKLAEEILRAQSLPTPSNTSPESS